MSESDVEAVQTQSKKKHEVLVQSWEMTRTPQVSENKNIADIKVNSYTLKVLKGKAPVAAEYSSMFEDKEIL